jgi:hypothetical protein
LGYRTVGWVFDDEFGAETCRRCHVSQNALADNKPTLYIWEDAFWLPGRIYDMVNAPTVVAAFVSVYLVGMTFTVLYLTYTAVKQDVSLSVGETGEAV